MIETSEIESNSGRKLDLIPRLATVPYGREMQAHILDLASLLLRKPIPSHKEGFRAIPEHSETHVDQDDCNLVLQRIEKVFLSGGAFMRPWELDRRLIEQSGRLIPAAALDLAEDYGTANRSAEPLTGGHRKAQVPLMTALAHIYGQVRNEKVFVFDLDYSNFEGTNLHNYKVLCAAEGRTNILDSQNKPVHDDLYHRAMAMTDRFARILAEIPNNVISGIAPGAHVERMRKGGDEVRYIGTGIREEQLPHILHDIHRRFEDLSRDLGLLDHNYGKNQALDYRRGAGAAIAVFRIAEPGTPYHVAANQADQAISSTKKTLGQERLDDYRPQNPPPGLNPDFFIDIKRDFMNTRYADQKTAHNYLEQMERAFEEYESRLGIQHPAAQSRLPQIKSIESLVLEAKPSHVPTPDDLRALTAQRYRGDLRERTIELSNDDSALAGLLFMKFPYLDHVTDTLMGTDFPMMVEFAIAASENNRALFQASSEEQKKLPESDLPLLWIMGVKFHNINGCNATLKTEGTNAVLDALSNSILKIALRDSGVGEKDAAIAHYGGGSFLSAILPVSRNPDDSFRVTSMETFHRVEKRVRELLEELNQTKISDFLNKHGLSLMDSSLVDRKLGDIPNGDLAQRGWKDGLTYTMTVLGLSPDDLLDREHNIGGAVAGMAQEVLKSEVSAKDAQRQQREPSTLPPPSPLM